MGNPIKLYPMENNTKNTRLWLILIIVLVADIMDMLDSTITNIAAPIISDTLNGGQSLIQWLGTSYTLSMGVLLVIGGRMGDKYGQRKLFLIGIAGFTISSLCCGLSLTPTMIIISRLVQGAFGALLIPQGVAIMTANFPRDMMTNAFAVFGPVISISMIIGPLLAGFLIHLDIFHTGWRSIFLINIVIGTLTFIAAYQILPKDKPDNSVVLDGIGSGLLGGTMFFLLYGLINGSTNNWNMMSIIMILLGTIFFGFFYLRQTIASNPLIKPTLLKNKGFTAGLILGLVYFAVVSGLCYIISLFLQLGLRASPFEASLDLVPLSVGIIISSLLVPKLIDKIGKKVISIGLLITALGLIHFYLAISSAISINPWSLYPPIFTIGFGFGFCFGTLFDFTLVDISPEEAGSASGSLSAVQQLSGSIGAAVLTSVFFSLKKSVTIIYSMQQSIIYILIALGLCLFLVRFLPEKTVEAHH